jgi:hypothetical protein
MERIVAAGGDAMVVSDDLETMEYLQWRLKQLLNPA